MNKRNNILTGLLLSTCSFFSAANAQPTQISVELKALESVRQQEAQGDEIYFNITEIPVNAKGHKSFFYQIPSYPSHWLSRYLKDVQNITLWKKTVNECIDRDVLISLVEEDMAPWDLNDLVGSIELKLRCEKGKTTQSWSIPNPSITSTVPNRPNAFSFTGKNAQYRAFFSFSEKPLPVGTQVEVPAQQELENTLHFPFFP